MITAEHPLRHPFQAMASLGQIYGDILYYATSMFDLYHNGLNYCRPEAYYFWCYYFFMNFIWIIIPGSKYLRSQLLHSHPGTDRLLQCFSTAASQRVPKRSNRWRGRPAGRRAIDRSRSTTDLPKARTRRKHSLSLMAYVCCTMDLTSMRGNAQWDGIVVQHGLTRLLALLSIAKSHSRRYSSRSSNKTV